MELAAGVWTAERFASDRRVGNRIPEKGMRRRLRGRAGRVTGKTVKDATGDGAALELVRALPVWRGTPRIEPLGGGLTNRNLLVTDDAGRFVVRLGDDIPVHHILRFNELAASRAAHAAGLSPAVRHAGPGVLVLDHIDGATMTAEDLRRPDRLAEALALVIATHRTLPRHLSGPALTFWVFQTLRDYAATLTAAGSRHKGGLATLMESAARLEAAVGRIDMVFGHNDLLPANFLHDGRRMWLIDWDYAGWGSALFDLGGLAANAGLSPEAEAWCLETYFGTAPDADLRRRYAAMKAAAALREAMWAMVQDGLSTLDADYAAYAQSYLETYRTALAAFETLA
jgi:thiamine kinase-like enzyme